MRRWLCCTACAGIALTLGTPAAAFHDSALDDDGKGFLAALLDRLQDHCNAGSEVACKGVEKIQAFGNRLVETMRTCATGDMAGCQEFARGQRELAYLMQQVAGIRSPDGPPAPPVDTEWGDRRFPEL